MQLNYIPPPSQYTYSEKKLQYETVNTKIKTKFSMYFLGGWGKWDIKPFFLFVFLFGLLNLPLNISFPYLISASLFIDQYQFSLVFFLTHLYYPLSLPLYSFLPLFNISTFINTFSFSHLMSLSFSCSSPVCDIAYLWPK